MEKKMKIKDLEGFLNVQSNVLIFRSRSTSELCDYEDLYDGFFKDIPDSFKGFNIFTMYPYIRYCCELPISYIYIQIW